MLRIKLRQLIKFLCSTSNYYSIFDVDIDVTKQLETPKDSIFIKPINFNK